MRFCRLFFPPEDHPSAQVIIRSICVLQGVVKQPVLVAPVGKCLRERKNMQKEVESFLGPGTEWISLPTVKRTVTSTTSNLT